MTPFTEHLEQIMPSAISGTIVRTVGMTAAVAGFPAPVGSLAEIRRDSGGPLTAEVIGFRDSLTLLYPHDDLAGVRHGNRVVLRRSAPFLRVGEGMLGRVIDATGNFVDGLPKPILADRVPYQQAPPHACDRPPIRKAIGTGIRSIDGMLTCGHGQRMGIFAGSGVGKSVTLGMMARYTSADIIVVGLIGERGRELNEFIERDLGPEGRKRSVVVVATSNEPAVLRVQAAQTATAVAEYFRDQGKNVLLMMDSLTRYALAQREIGLAAGEPPTTRGYPPSVFAMLPRLVERAGRARKGSITAFYTVLVEGDDPNEPIADAVRGLLDGHIWLSRDLAAKGHYPAVDILGSLSRLMPNITQREQQDAAFTVRDLLSAYRDHEDLISIGAYRRGSNPRVDTAIELQDALRAYLRQRVDEPSTVEQAADGLVKVHAAATAMQQKAAKQAAKQTPGG